MFYSQIVPFGNFSLIYIFEADSGTKDDDKIDTKSDETELILKLSYEFDMYCLLSELCYPYAIMVLPLA